VAADDVDRFRRKQDLIPRRIATHDFEYHAPPVVAISGTTYEAASSNSFPFLLM
jgi:hypothetical protein